MSDPARMISFDVDTVLAELDPDGRCHQYFELLTRENERLNLVSRETIATGLPRLAAESLLPKKILGDLSGLTYLDIGSGGGMPSIPMMLTSQFARSTLVERTLKKAAALRRMCSELALEVNVLERTFEEISLDTQYDLVTVRLVRATPRLLCTVADSLAPGGRLVWYAVPEVEMPPDLSPDEYSYQPDNQPNAKAFSVLQKSP